MNFVFAVDDLVRLDRAFAMAPDIVRSEVLQFLHAATQYLKGEVIQRTPAAQGALRDSINADVATYPESIAIGVVGTALSYAVPVELGTKPHWAPLEPLVQWVHVKLGLAGREARNVARAVQYKIAKHGTKPVGMFDKGFSAGRASVEARFRLAAERVAARIAGAAT